MTSRASLLAIATGCGAEPVEARAVWVDESGGDGRRRVHVYDRGELESFEVLGETEPIQRLRLDPHGRGVLIRTGTRRGAWFDLTDGRRLPLLLPPTYLDGDGLANIEFGHGALAWIDTYDGALTVVPLAVGLELPRRSDGTIEPLTRASGPGWVVAAERAPIVFASDSERASFLRYPTRVDQPQVIALESEAEPLPLPAVAVAEHSCEDRSKCWTSVALDPRGELAIFSEDAINGAGPWAVFERRSPELAGPLELPPDMAESADLRLLQVLDRSVSIWLGAQQLHRLDHRRGTADSLPMFAEEPLHWTAADQGRAMILVSTWGPVFRADLDGLRAFSLETTQCQVPGDPVVSPSGRWVAWTCVDVPLALGDPPPSGAVVRVSAAGLERYVGVPMATLAIDDAGDLLLYSVESVEDTLLDAIGTVSIPQTLFVLSGDGVLTRVDELEPAPSPVLIGSGELGSYIQGVALAPE